LADPERRWPALEIAGAALLPSADRLLTILDDHNPLGIDEREAGVWRVFFPDAARRDAAGRAVGAVFATARDISVRPIDVADERWAERSQANLTAVRVGRVIVAPPWDIPSSPAADDILIVIQPSMGFGTGHHASTRLCLAAIQRLPLGGRSVLDVGTGSGLLAIAAHRLGAARAAGIDRDPDAIQSARENVDLNGVAADVDLRVADIRDPDLPHADIVIANLTGALLSRYRAELLARVPQAGRLIVSGFTVEEEPAVRQAFAPGAITGERDQEDEWVCLTLRTM